MMADPACRTRPLEISMNRLSLPPLPTFAAAGALALAAALGAGVAAAQSIDLPQRPQPVPKPAPKPAPAASGVDTSASGTQHVEVQGTGGGVNASPAGQLAQRTGAYSVKSEGSIAIRARCLEGGTVWVSKHSIERASGATDSERRDAALRQSCRDVDFSK
jgi:hypothetical protein